VAGFPGDPFGDGHAVFLRLVREHRTGDDIADGPNAGNVCLEMGVDVDAFLLVELHANLFETETVGERPAADGHENFVRGKFEHLAVTLGRENGLLTVLFEPGDFRASLDFEALFDEESGEVPHDVLVVGRDNFRQKFHDGHVAAEAGPDGAELQADGAAADDHEFLWDLVEKQSRGRWKRRSCRRIS